jgi:hypothetical protein
MIKTSEITVTTEKVDSITCDKCKKTYKTNANDMRTDIELNEMLHMHFHTGYGSVFGDESVVEGDFCQHCVQDLLGPYVRVESQYESGLSA